MSILAFKKMEGRKKSIFILVVDQKVQMSKASSEASFFSTVIGSTTYTQSKPRL